MHRLPCARAPEPAARSSQQSQPAGHAAQPAVCPCVPMLTPFSWCLCLRSVFALQAVHAQPCGCLPVSYVFSSVGSHTPLWPATCLM